jgi:GntR family transcriptional regulator
LRLAASLPGVTIIDARQTLTVGAADVETADQLQIPLNAPVVHINRSAVDQKGNLVLVANGIYRGDVIRVDFKLR